MPHRERTSKLAKNIVTIGGGSGHYALLSSLRDMQQINITAVVSMADSGGSTGRLRDELGILPPGDILKCILALSPQQDAVRGLFQKRFQTDQRLRGHSVGNMLLTMLTRYTGSFPRGVQALTEILDTKGRILPVTTDRATLVAELTDGKRIFGENAIDAPRENRREKIRNVFLVPHHVNEISVYPPVVDAIKKADFIILGPGDLYTSIIPNLLVPGVVTALRENRANLVYIINIMTKHGETNNFTGTDFVNHLESFTGRSIDFLICNTTRPSKSIRNRYAAENAEFVKCDFDVGFSERMQVINTDLLDVSDQLIRHDTVKLSGLLQSIFTAKPPRQ